MAKRNTFKHGQAVEVRGVGSTGWYPYVYFRESNDHGVIRHIVVIDFDDIWWNSRHVKKVEVEK